MVRLRAWLRNLEAAIIIDDPDPEYSQLDLMDGLRHHERQPRRTVRCNHAKIESAAANGPNAPSMMLRDLRTSS